MNDEPACRQAGNLIIIPLELLLASCVISPNVEMTIYCYTL
ncbi:hypothetical protein [Dokdonia sp.]